MTITGPTGGPCAPWPLATYCTSMIPQGVDANLLAEQQLVATQTLWALSGRRWGPCPVTVRPCRKVDAESLLMARSFQGFGSGSFGSGWIPYIFDGVWRNAAICGCSGSCSCTELCEVLLPGPVHDIVEVKIDGAVIDPNDYRLDSPGNKLVRQGTDCWPRCQSLNLPADQVGTFSVEYNIGLPLNEAAKAAVTELTAELVKGCMGADCKLPRRVTQISRAGVVAQFIDPMHFLKDGRTGLYLVDLWLQSVNPKSMDSPSRVMSPDHRPPRMTTWQA